MLDSKQHIKPLTSIRFFAAFFVMSSHLGYFNNTDLSFIFTNEGYIGVTLFFILSGFILAFSYQDRLNEKKTSVHKFYFARIARIYPIHIITFILAIYLFSLTNFDFGFYFYNISLLHAYIPDKHAYFSFNMPSWSLSVEMFFYLLFPLLIKINNKNLILLSIASILAKILFPITSGPLVHALMYISPFFRLHDFIIGILLYRYRSIFSFNLSALIVTTLQVLSISSIFLFVHFSYLIPQSYRYDIYYIIPMSITIFSLSIRGGIIGNIMSNNILVLLGEASFSLYMIHQLVIRYLIDSKLKYNLDNNELLFLMIFLSISLSVIAYKFLEIPLKNITLKLLNILYNKFVEKSA
ncbi:acyltransferase family protein [Proteus mirabilis]|uniref:acyltransferase family protein n=1 Tax=Proteus mirabilis TaxID=584 RepID=UPI0010736657|nr:acyltransferase [Proteus mirabilis]MDM3831296.1 acyltransferase [Proteus mirabilis]MEC4044884.1 acyltransferase [Proteus mirabilis]NHI95959.1 acyltransferase [Proteus mirabilis]TFT78118.1 acyltransferase [Proteus mirabilis]